MRNREIGIWWTKIYLWPASMQSDNTASRKRRTLARIINATRKGKKTGGREEKDQRKDSRD